MNHPDPDEADREIDALVGASFTAHGDRLGPTFGDVDDVWDRVERRRSRRRMVAAVGSLAVIAAGAVGFAALDRSDGDGFSATDGPTTTTIEWAMHPTTTMVAVASNMAGAWACTSRVDAPAADPAYEYFWHCFPVDEPGPQTTTTTTTTIAATTSIGATEPADDATDSSDHTTTTSIVYDTEYLGGESGLVHLVVPGDSVYSISVSYQISPEDLAAFNEWSDGIEHVLFVGDLIPLPPSASRVPTTTTPPFRDPATVPSSTSVP